MDRLDIDWRVVRDVLEACWRCRGVHGGFKFRERREVYKATLGDERHLTDRQLAEFDSSFSYATDESLIVLRHVEGAPCFGMPDCWQVRGLTNKGRDLLSVLDSAGVMDEILSVARGRGLSLTADAIIEAGNHMLACRIKDGLFVSMLTHSYIHSDSEPPEDCKLKRID